MFVIENKNHKEPAKQQQLTLLNAHYGSMFSFLFIFGHAIYGYFYGY